jgi:hypothetical protein
MKDIPETYALESVEQLRVIADELRQRICDALSSRPMTITQLGEILGQPPAKILYHVRELVRVDLVRLVETREKGGVLEKYYRVVAEAFTVPPTLLSTLGPDERRATAQDLVGDIAQGLSAAFARRTSTEPGEGRKLTLSRSYRWMTDDEVARVYADIQRILEPYELREASPDAEERAVVIGFYTVKSPDAAACPKRAVAVGTTTYDREALETVIRAGESLDLIAVGEVTFADDVTPEAVDAAISHFRLQGTLRATEAVRAVLARKEEPVHS